MDMGQGETRDRIRTWERHGTDDIGHERYMGETQNMGETWDMRRHRVQR